MLPLYISMMRGFSIRPTRCGPLGRNANRTPRARANSAEAAENDASDEFGSPRMGDLNCDGALNALDIEPFILALLDPPAYAAAHPACDIALADVDCSGVADPADIGPLVQLLLGP